MRTRQAIAIGPLSLCSWVAARSYILPSNIREFYNGLVDNKTCTDKLATGFYSTYPGKNTFSYCQDHLNDYNILYIQGNNGLLADMGVDCDGVIRKGAENDGRCDKSKDRSDETAFRETLQGYNKGIRDLDPYVHSYIVLGNDGSEHGGITFDPTEYGIEPLSVCAVVCNNKLFYAVWGDEYGGRRPMVGAASLSLATACFGRSMNGNNGHDANDVLYIAFRGKDAVPGANGAAWGAKTWMDFHESIRGLGDKLIQRIPGVGNWSGPTLRTMRVGV